MHDVFKNVENYLRRNDQDQLADVYAYHLAKIAAPAPIADEVAGGPISKGFLNSLKANIQAMSAAAMKGGALAADVGIMGRFEDIAQRAPGLIAMIDAELALRPPEPKASAPMSRADDPVVIANVRAKLSKAGFKKVADTPVKLKGCGLCFGSGGKKNAPCVRCKGAGKVAIEERASESAPRTEATDIATGWPWAKESTTEAQDGASPHADQGQSATNSSPKAPINGVKDVVELQKAGPCGTYPNCIGATCSYCLSMVNLPETPPR